MSSPRHTSQAKREAAREIARNLREWGIEASSSENKKHRKFAEEAIRIVESCHDITAASRSSKPQILSENYELAVETVLRGEIASKRESRCRFITDRITGGVPSPPYYVRPHKFRPDRFFVKIKWEYDRLSKTDLDPLSRFTQEKVTKREFFNEVWALRLDDESIQGHVFEAIVVSHAIHKEACFLCKRRNSLRWNGGPEGAWTDMECLSCESVYEIKSKRDMEAIEKGNEYNIWGGSYRAFYQLHQQKRRAGWKHYLVEVSRMPSYSRIPELGPGLHKCWVLHIAEIDRILPRLKASCFLDGPKMKIGSMIVTKSATTPWVQIPFVDLDHKPIVLKLLEEYFPLRNGMSRSSEKKKKESEAEKNSDSPDIDLATIRKGLESMSSGVDDWEDLLDDEE